MQRSSIVELTYALIHLHPSSIHEQDTNSSDWHAVYYEMVDEGDGIAVIRDEVHSDGPRRWICPDVLGQVLFPATVSGFVELRLARSASNVSRVSLECLPEFAGQS